MVGYLEKHWWRHKERCVKYWTNKIRHFGHDTTSPSEGGHAVLKDWLRSSKHDVLGLFKNMQPYYDSHTDRYKTSLAMQTNIAMTQYRTIPFYQMLNRRLSRKSLNQLHEQRAQALGILRSQQDDITYVMPPCTKVFKRIYGMPYAHELIEYLLSDNMVLVPTKFHAYHCLPNAALETIDVP
jgi:hypothetical protein